MNATTSIHTAQVTHTLAIQSCITCGIVWGQPQHFDLECRRRGSAMTFYCPNGHGQFYTESEADRERKAREQAEKNAKWWEQRADIYRAEAERAEKSLRTTNGHLTRLKNRAEAGVCIHCNRTFQNVARHMNSKHREAQP